MNFIKLVPNIFYLDIREGIKLFVDCLQFEIEHEELNAFIPFCVVGKNGLRINLFQNRDLANEHHPEFRLVTDNIEEVYQKIVAYDPELLHPNLNSITLRPWGAREFAIKDKQLGIIVQQW